MAAARKKMTRKELLKKPDEFITFSNRVYNWVRLHLPKVIIGLSAILLAALLFFGYRTYTQWQENLAHEQYFLSQEEKDPDQKIKKLAALVQDFPRTLAAQNGRIQLGHLYYQKSDFPKAITAYQSALDHGNLPSSLRVMVLESLAYAQEQKGDLPQAARLFSEITRGGQDLLKENAQLSLARVYQKQGKKAEAKSAYQEFLKRFPESPFAQVVKDRINRL